ncbi:MAG: carbamate kinase [Acidimicrobiales bacterium]|nr:carbamate kinase [Acidimicrobiales bacterium]
MQRAVLALGGNAISPHASAGTAAEQTATIGLTMKAVAELVVEGWHVVLTHGNGPQVGNVLVKNELAKDVVPPVPLDWCVAQTQATIGFTAATALEWELAQRGHDAAVVPVVSRVLVSRDDPAWDHPTKPIGRGVDEAEARRRMAAGDQRWVDDGDRGWRRVVPSPRPLRSLDRTAIDLLLDDGAVVIANGGGGIPMVDAEDGPPRGVEAVVDKDLAAALLAQEIGAEVLAILTDVEGVAIDFGQPDQRWLGRVGVAELRRHAEAGQFRAGSMGPKVEAVCGFVERTGHRAAVGALDDAIGAVHGDVGTQVVAEESP